MSLCVMASVFLVGLGRKLLFFPHTLIIRVIYLVILRHTGAEYMMAVSISGIRTVVPWYQYRDGFFFLPVPSPDRDETRWFDASRVIPGFGSIGGISIVWPWVR